MGVNKAAFVLENPTSEIKKIRIVNYDFSLPKETMYPKMYHVYRTSPPMFNFSPEYR